MLIDLSTIGSESGITIYVYIFAKIILNTESNITLSQWLEYVGRFLNVPP